MVWGQRAPARQSGAPLAGWIVWIRPRSRCCSPRCPGMESGAPGDTAGAGCAGADRPVRQGRGGSVLAIRCSRREGATAAGSAEEANAPVGPGGHRGATAARAVALPGLAPGLMKSESALRGRAPSTAQKGAYEGAAAQDTRTSYNGEQEGQQTNPEPAEGPRARLQRGQAGGKRLMTRRSVSPITRRKLKPQGGATAHLSAGLPPASQPRTREAGRRRTGPAQAAGSIARSFPGKREAGSHPAPRKLFEGDGICVSKRRTPTFTTEHPTDAVQGRGCRAEGAQTGLNWMDSRKVGGLEAQSHRDGAGGPHSVGSTGTDHSAGRWPLRGRRGRRGRQMGETVQGANLQL